MNGENIKVVGNPCNMPGPLTSHRCTALLPSHGGATLKAHHSQDGEAFKPPPKVDSKGRAPDPLRNTGNGWDSEALTSSFCCFLRYLFPVEDLLELKVKLQNPFIEAAPKASLSL